MSENEDNGSNAPKKPPPSQFQPKVWIIWMAILALIFTLYYGTGPNGGKGDFNWTIKELMGAVEEGEVEKGTIKNNPAGGEQFYTITVVLKKRNEQGKVQHRLAKGRLTEKNVEALQESGLFEEEEANPIVAEMLVTIFTFVVIIGLLYFLFVRQLRSAGKGAMNFGKSRAKMLTRDHDKVNFKDVAGCDEAKEEVSEIVEFLKDPKKFQRIGGRIPKGVLLVGPPGTGKTLLARAVAGEADVPFFSISGSDFVEMFVGVGAARVRDMFEQGRKSAPCLIFIDEIDAVGRQRGAGLGGGNDEREQTLNSLLVEMDGFDSHEGVIIIAATNRPDVLDSALLRPGRFDRQIYVDLPDLPGREDILKVHAKKIKISAEVELHVVARNTPGFSGADLANLLNEAALLAARYDKTDVGMMEIDEARDKISYGRERRKLMDEEDKKITAFHEAGHAIVQAVIDDGHLPVHKVTIIPRGQSLGSTMFVPKKDILNHSKTRLLNQVCCAMGGRVAEELTFDETTSGAAGDIKMATKIARHMVCDWGMSELGMVAYGDNQDPVFLGKEILRGQHEYSEETSQRIDKAIRDIIEREYQRASEILTARRKDLEVMADALIEYETIEGKHVHEILEHGEIRSPIEARVAPEEPAEEPVPEEEAEPVPEDSRGEELGPGANPAGVPA